MDEDRVDGQRLPQPDEPGSDEQMDPKVRVKIREVRDEFNRIGPDPVPMERS
jgi:hypothetical protein